MKIPVHKLEYTQRHTLIDIGQSNTIQWSSLEASRCQLITSKVCSLYNAYSNPSKHKARSDFKLDRLVVDTVTRTGMSGKPVFLLWVRHLGHEHLCDIVLAHVVVGRPHAFLLEPPWQNA